LELKEEIMRDNGSFEDQVSALKIEWFVKEEANEK